MPVLWSVESINVYRFIILSLQSFSFCFETVVYYQTIYNHTILADASAAIFKISGLLQSAAGRQFCGQNAK